MRTNKRLIEKSTDKLQVYYQTDENWYKLSYVEKWLINNTGKLNRHESEELQKFVDKCYSCGHDGYAILNSLSYVMENYHV